MLQTYRELQIVNPGRVEIIEDFSDRVELDEVAAYRPSHKGLPVEAAEYRNAAQDQARRDRHRTHGARLVPARHWAERTPDLRGRELHHIIVCATPVQSGESTSNRRFPPAAKPGVRQSDESAAHLRQAPANGPRRRATVRCPPG